MNEWCTGCKEYDTEKHCCPRFNKVIRNTLNDSINEVLDNIRAEIGQLTIIEGGDDYVRKMAELFSLKMKVLQIIDKYRAESGDKK